MIAPGAPPVATDTGTGRRFVTPGYAAGFAVVVSLFFL